MNEGMNMGPSPEELKRRDDIMKKAASTLGITVEEVKERLLKILGEKSDIQELADHFAMHPEQLEFPKTLNEAGPKITELEAMITSFEATHSLEELHAITDLSPELAIVFTFAKEISYTPEQLEHLLRHVTVVEPKYAEIQRKKIAEAKAIVLTPEDTEIYNKRIAAKNDLELIVAMLSTLKNEELKMKCKRLMKAVGSIKNGKVNHE